MWLVKPSVELLWLTNNPLEMIEKAGRTCYKSEDKITKESAPKFVQMLLDQTHEAMIEHASMSMKFICDRGVSHEIVRHRLFSYAQESTRYCNYKGGVVFVIPCWIDLPTTIKEGEDYILRSNFEIGEIIENTTDAWIWAMAYAETRYQNLLKEGWTPQQARSVLPNSLKTEIVITGNFREWGHFFKLRCATTAHPQMQEVANMALKIAQENVPVIFNQRI